MTRDEALQWLGERFRPAFLEANPDWVETMVELLTVRTSPHGERFDSSRRSPLESVGASA